jgi:hypothetical protein
LAENSVLAAPSKKKRFSIPPAALVAGAMALAGLAGFWYLGKPGSPKELAPLTGPARAYVRNLKLSNVDMQAHESYLKQSIVEITGNIGNTGDRVLRTVEINCVFYDPYGQVVSRERVAIVNGKSGALAPGEIKPFRMAFDDVPEGWNQAMPQMVIAAIDFS